MSRRSCETWESLLYLSHTSPCHLERSRIIPCANDRFVILSETLFFLSSEGPGRAA
jgi:hypothetical protein